MAVVGHLDRCQLAKRIVNEGNVNADSISIYGIPDKLCDGEHGPSSRCQPFQMVILDLDLDSFAHRMVASLLGRHQLKHFSLSMGSFNGRDHVHQLGDGNVS